MTWTRRRPRAAAREMPGRGCGPGRARLQSSRPAARAIRACAAVGLLALAGAPLREAAAQAAPTPARALPAPTGEAAPAPTAEAESTLTAHAAPAPTAPAAAPAAPPQTAAPPAKAVQSIPQPPSPPAAHWYNPLTWPFIPIPEIITDPDSGTTVGLLPTWLITNQQHHIDRIIAPDVQHNPYFGWGAHARILDYPSEDVQWSAVGGASERVQRKIDLEYLNGRLREHRWSYGASLLYLRDGTPRFYGIGNHSPEADQTNYTLNQDLGQATVGLNLSRLWQVSYTLQWQQVEVLPGTLPRIPSVETLFGRDILVTDHALLHQLALTYDSRDDVTIPTRGTRWIAYGGIATSSVFGTTLYTHAGIDGSAYWSVRPTTIVATHVAVRYMPSDPHAAFWELSSLGGGTSVPGGMQPLRGFGQGRFTDRNLFSATAELRQRIVDLPIFNTDIAIEVTPFVDVGKVFSRLGASPVTDLHKVFGLGFRGVAAPFVVGFVDIGYGSEGAAVFTGVNYPF